jgi:hypothetical protein
MYTKHLVYAANFTTFYYNVGIFFIIKKGNRGWKKIGVQNVQKQKILIFFLDYKTKSKKASKLDGND